MAGLEDRVGGGEHRPPTSPSATGPRDCTTSPASSPTADAREPSAALGALAADGADDELVALEQADRGRVGADQARRLPDDLVEDRLGVELAGEQRPGPGELLRDRARLALRLVELRPLERAAGRAGETGVRARSRRRVKDCSSAKKTRPSPGRLAPRRLDGDREERREARRARPARASRLRSGRRTHDSGAARTRRRRCAASRSGAVAAAAPREEVRDALGQLVRAGEVEVARLGHEHGGEGAAERLACRLGDGVERLGERERLREHRRDPEEPALDPHLPRALLDARDVPEGDASPRLAKASSTSTSSRLKVLAPVARRRRRSRRGPRPTTSSARPSRAAKPSYAGCGASTSSYSLEIVPAPRRIASPASALLGRELEVDRAPQGSP